MFPPFPPTQFLNDCYGQPLLPGGSMGINSTMPDDHRGIIHRELLKERIRKEMYDDMAREKALEMELKREILMERDFLVPKFIPPNEPYERVLKEWSVSRSSGFFDDWLRDKVPFQRHPQAMGPKVESVPESANGRLLLLPKPNGKALPKIGFANSTKPNIRGSLRQLSLNSAKTTNNHVPSKNHQYKAAKPKIEQTCNQEKLKPDKKVLPKTGFADTTKQDFRCDICQLSVGSAKTMEDHIRGKKHQAKIAKPDEKPNQEKLKALQEENSALLIKLKESIDALNKAQLEVNALMSEKARIEMLYKKNMEELKKVEEHASEANIAK